MDSLLVSRFFIRLDQDFFLILKIQLHLVGFHVSPHLDFVAIGYGAP